MCIFIYIYTLYLINFISVSTSDLYYFLFYIKINYILSFGLNLNGFLEQQHIVLFSLVMRLLLSTINKIDQENNLFINTILSKLIYTYIYPLIYFLLYFIFKTLYIVK